MPPLPLHDVQTCVADRADREGSEVEKLIRNLQVDRGDEIPKLVHPVHVHVARHR